MQSTNPQYQGFESCMRHKAQVHQSQQFEQEPFPYQFKQYLQYGVEVAYLGTFMDPVLDFSASIGMQRCVPLHSAEGCWKRDIAVP
jgi:hypothetical protein